MSTPLDFKLSKNFAWGELTRTGQTALQDQNREEAEAFRPALTALATTLLQPVRDRWGALRINSAFRGKSVNQKVGGAKASQHLIGEAVDFSPLSEGVTLEMIFDWLRKESGLPYGQVIHECPSPTSRWIHLSLGEPWRKGPCREALFFDGKKYHPVK